MIEEISGVPVFVCSAEGAPVAGEPDALDLIGGSGGAEWVVVPVERLHPDFFSLRTGVAGAVVQKFASYRCGLAVLGDVSAHVAGGGAFADFVREAGRGRQLVFAADRVELGERLAVVRRRMGG